MNYKEVQALLKEKGSEGIDTQVFLVYLRNLVEEKNRQGQLKNAWASRVTPSEYAHAYEKVKAAGCLLDGNLVTLQWKGKLLISYNYKAYKNRVLHHYPKTIFDIQLVRAEDKFSVRKKNGKVIYEHEMGGLWKTEQENQIVGAYCIIKNERGEFFEVVNMEDVRKMRAVAKTQNVWKEWFGEMVKKSVIKRACKFHFEDIVEIMEEDDNENYDLDKEGVPEYIVQKINEAMDDDDLHDIYSDEMDNCDDKKVFLTLIQERKKELKIIA